MDHETLPSPPVPNEPDEARSAPVQFSMRTMFVVTIGVAVIASFCSWTSFGGPLGVLIVGGWWSWLAVRHGARRIAYYVTGFMQGAVLASLLVLPTSDDHAWCVVWTGGFCCSTLATVWILRGEILRPTRVTPWKAVFAAPYTATAAFWLGVSVAIEASVISRGFNVGEMLDTGMMFVLILLIGIPIFVTVTLPITLPLSISFCLWLRAVAGVRPSPPSMSTAMTELAKIPRKSF